MSATNRASESSSIGADAFGATWMCSNSPCQCMRSSSHWRTARITAILRLFGGQLVQQVCGFGKVVYPEDDQRTRGSGLQSAVRVVDVDPIFAQPRGGSAQ